MGSNDTVNDPHREQVSFNAVVSGAAILTKIGSGTLVMVAANTLTGVKFINAGIIQINSSGALGTAAAATAAVVASGASLQALGNGFTGITVPLVLNGNGADGLGALRFLAGSVNSAAGTYIGGTAGNITLASSSSIGVDASLNFVIQPTAGIGITGPGDLTKLGQGTLTLNPTVAGDNYSGNTIVSGGILQVQTSTSLGLPTLVNGAVTVSSGATLQLNLAAGLTIAGKNITLNGTGFGNGGQDRLPRGPSW